MSPKSCRLERPAVPSVHEGSYLLQLALSHIRRRVRKPAELHRVGLRLGIEVNGFVPVTLLQRYVLTQPVHGGN